MSKKNDVIIINRTICAYAENGAQALHYQNLTWDEATTLCRLSSAQGFECVLYIPGEEPANDGSAGDCSIF